MLLKGRIQQGQNMENPTSEAEGKTFWLITSWVGLFVFLSGIGKDKWPLVIVALYGEFILFFKLFAGLFGNVILFLWSYKQKVAFQTFRRFWILETYIYVYVRT